MPGAPNRPPETSPPAVPAPPAGLDGAARKSLRRLVPARAALLLDLWKGSVPADLFTPYAHAEAAFAQHDYAASENHLDRLAVRFAEPRWPTLPMPFRELRVTIVQPMPPHWDPDHALPPGEKEAKRQRAYADLQVALATATVAWMAGHAIDSDDLGTELAEAKSTLDRDGATDAFWTAIDHVWTSAYPRLPSPAVAGGRPAPVAAPAPPEAADPA